MTDETPLIDPWLGALRVGGQRIPAAARARLSARLPAELLVAAGAAAPVLLAPALKRAFWHSRWFVGAVALPVGIVIGAVGQTYRLRSAAVPVVAAKQATSATAITAPAAASAPLPEPVVALEAARPESPPSKPLAPSAAASRAEPSAALAAPSSEPASLERELSLLERARARLAEGQPRATLQLLRQHEAAYPSSVLQQEREVLTIRALSAAGRLPEAKTRAQAFIAAYPGSALRASVLRAVGTIP